jgi:DNA polymerase
MAESIPYRSLTALAQAEAQCTRCPLYKNATQAVPGEGSARSRVMMVGEQPGDKEDLAGKPFVGPAGRMLDRAFE